MLVGANHLRFRQADIHTSLSYQAVHFRLVRSVARSFQITVEDNRRAARPNTSVADIRRRIERAPPRPVAELKGDAPVEDQSTTRSCCAVLGLTQWHDGA